MQNTETTIVENAVDVADAATASGGDSLFFIVLTAVVMLVAMLSAVSAVVSFMLTMTVLRVPEENRKMTLGSLWLIMAPLYGIYQLWITTQKLADSFDAYFDAQDPDDVEKPLGDFGRKFGLYMCASAAAGHVAMILAVFGNPWILGIALGICLLAGLVCATIYFWQIFKIRRQIPDPESEIPEDYL
ncbi:MAG: hypothetical protein AAF585_03075 [Verrucomicrobiota bacterium]